MNTSEASVVEVNPWGFQRLEPIPSPEDLHRFYQSAYADLACLERRAPDLRRILRGGPEAEEERVWLRATLFADILATLDEHEPRRNLPALDVGAGTGEWVGELAQAGWDAIGLEPSEEASELARGLGRRVEALTLDEYLSAPDRPTAFGVVSVLNVLEHLPDPVSFCDQMRALLAPGGMIVVRVPNEFNPLQRAAQAVLGRAPWWVVAPDHINYFDHASVARLLEDRGFDVLVVQADFPMEIFLLMGLNYLDDPAVGRECHARRRRAELAMDPSTRRALGRSLVSAGVGRNSLVVAKRRG